MKFIDTFQSSCEELSKFIANKFVETFTLEKLKHYGSKKIFFHI